VVEGSMRIAMVAPPWLEVPPQGYGGIEAVCADLADGLVARGHEVHLFGSGENRTSANFLRTYEDPPTELIGASEPEVVHAAQVAATLEEIEVDLVHDHSLAGLLLARGRSVPTVATVHGPVTGGYGTYLRLLGATVHLVAISQAQRRPAPDLNWAATVYNAIPVHEYPFRPDKEDFALFLGRMSPTKGAHIAIDVARKAGVRLMVAAKLSEPPEHEYFAAEVEPRLGDGVEWLGEADAESKRELLAAARCLLFPLQWEEPFGLVMVEALACGTPVVAADLPALREILADQAELVPPGDADALADALLRVLDDPGGEPARAARRARAAGFTWDACARATLAAYDRALGTAR
jgi:glycosyltransferase involved in cell wall biosynthesis